MHRRLEGLAPQRTTGRTTIRVPGLGRIYNLRCSCGHELDRHLETEACDVESCPCLGFEAAWEDEDEALVA